MPGARAESRRIAAIVWKDLTAERRSKANFNSVAFFALLTLLLFGFALGPDPDALRGAAPGVLWLTVLFSAVLAFNRSYQTELESGALDALLLYPGSRKSILAGKLAGNLCFILVIEALVLPAAALLYGLPFDSRLLSVAGVLVAGSIGLVTLGTFYAAMSSRVRAREVLLPLLLFPVLVPVLLASVEATSALLSGDAMGNAGSWIRLLVVFDVVFVAASFLAFDHVIGE